MVDGNVETADVLKHELALDVSTHAPKLGGVSAVVVTGDVAWRSDFSEQEELARAVVTGSSHPSEKAQAVKAMLEAGCSSAAETVLAEGGALAMEAVIAWVDESASTHSVPYAWASALGRRQQDVLASLVAAHGLHPSTVARAVEWLDPGSGPVQEHLGFWTALAETGGALVPAQDWIRLCSFTVAVCLLSNSPSSSVLMGKTFRYVHDAAASDRLDGQAWRWLSHLAKPTRWWREWDKCERLRAALARRAVELSYPVDALLTAVGADHHFEDVISFAKREPHGGEYIRLLIQQAAAAPSRVSDARQGILRKYS